MPTASSIYWNSVDSQLSSTSSGTVRKYVDPWDLENYAYMRRNSISIVPQASSHRQRSRRPMSENWSSSGVVGYMDQVSLDQHYFGSSRHVNHIDEHYQPIDNLEDATTKKFGRVYELTTDFNIRNGSDNAGWNNEVNRRRKPARFATSTRHEPVYQHSSTWRKDNYCDESVPGMMLINEGEPSHVEVTPGPKLGFNNYGHLKIDYSNSWDLLHRKITK